MARHAGVTLQPVVELGNSSSDQEPGEEEEKSSFSVWDVVVFAARSARKNLWFCLLVMLGVAALGSTIVVSMPNVYDSTGKIFVQHSGMITSSLASGREQWKEVDGKRGLQEVLLARDNLLSIVREARLIERWPRTRPLPLRVKDRVSLTLFGPPSRKELEHSFVDMLATSITGGEETESVRFNAQWRDPQSAYEIATLLQRNFLAARAASELGPIKRAIAVLESQLEQAERGIETAVTLVQTAKTHGPKKPAAGAEAAAGGAQAQNNASMGELAKLSRELADVRREKRALADPWQKRSSELKAQLVELKTSYSADHPLVRQQEAKIAAASEVPAELASLKSQETALLSSIASHGGIASVREARADTQVDLGGGGPREDPELAAPKARLTAALRKSDEIAGRLDLARVELATAESEFKHRYVVVEAPEVPRKPVSRKRTLFFGVVFAAACLLGFLSGAVRELLRGRIVEPWQVRALGLDILAEVDLKELPPSSGAGG